MQQQIKAKVAEVVKLAKELYDFPISVQAITMTFRRTGQAAAQAGVRRNRATGKSTYLLKFSLEAAALNPDEMLNDTIPHEVAHLVNFWDKRTGDDHNPGWKNVCRRLGGTGVRCHSQKLTKTKYRRQYLYITDGGTERIVKSAAKHNRIQRGTRYTTSKTREVYGAEHFVRVIPAAEHKARHLKEVAQYAAKNGAPAAPVSAPPTPKVTRQPVARAAASKQSKISLCRNAYDPSASRADNINTFIVHAGCTKAGAATYYATIKAGR